jgi:spermidine/putrescine transport system substrate-binding protein
MVASPFYSRSSRATSGELNLMMWSDEFPDPIIPNFERETGIKVNRLAFSVDEEQIFKLSSPNIQAADVCQPPFAGRGQYLGNGLLQPIDMAKINGYDLVYPAMEKYITTFWTENTDRFFLPHSWRAEGISYRTDKISIPNSQLGYSSLWEKNVEGYVQGRVHSLLVGIGLLLDHTQQWQSNRLLDTLRSEAEFRNTWDRILNFASGHKGWIRQFWSTPQEASIGFASNDVWIGQTREPRNDGQMKLPHYVKFVAPLEGPLAWLDGLALTKNAQNVDQAYAFFNYILRPEVAALISENSGYWPVVKSAVQHMNTSLAKRFTETYSDDALSNLWLWPPVPNWYAELRAEYADRFKAA